MLGRAHLYFGAALHKVTKQWLWLVLHSHISLQ